MTNSKLKQREDPPHTGSPECNPCDKDFSSNWDYTRHLKLYTWGKPYHCNQCCEAFSDNINFTVHVNSQMKENHISVNSATCVFQGMITLRKTISLQ